MAIWTLDRLARFSKGIADDLGGTPVARCPVCPPSIGLFSGERQTRIYLKKIEDGEAEDVKLEADDILFVPHSGGKATMQSLQDIRDVCHVVVHGREFMVVAGSEDEAKRKAVTDCLNTRSDVGDNWDWESFERELWQHVEATKEEPKRRRGK